MTRIILSEAVETPLMAVLVEVFAPSTARMSADTAIRRCG